MRATRPFTLLIALALVYTLSPPSTRAQERGAAVGPVGSRPVAARYYALVIGNNTYRHLKKLETARADAEEIEQLLARDYGFKTKKLPDATRDEIIKALSDYRGELGPDDSLLVYYAGHGVNDKGAETAYWLPVDASEGDPSHWISADDITRSVRAIPARHVLVISDSCYSGALTRSGRDSLPRPTEREQFLARVAAGHSRTLMASGGDEPVLDGGGGGHSAFAAALLRGLREIEEARFTAGELFNEYVEEAVTGNSTQLPEYSTLRNSGHVNGDFVFERTRGGEKARPTAAAMPPPAPKPDPAQQEREYWNSIRNSNDPEDYRAYLRAYPRGKFAALAANKLRALERPAEPTAPSPGVHRPDSGQTSLSVASAFFYCSAPLARIGEPRDTTLDCRLSVIGRGWGVSNLKVFVNGMDVSKQITAQNESLITLEGKVNVMNLVSGRNEVFITVGEETSNTYAFIQVIK
jgi:hypothetical protein